MASTHQFVLGHRIIQVPGLTETPMFSHSVPQPSFGEAYRDDTTDTFRLIGSVTIHETIILFLF